MRKKIVLSKPEEIIHVKLEYLEAYEEKRNLLSSEMSFLRIARSLKNYQSLRQEELSVKLRIVKKINEVNVYIRKMEMLLPKIRIPEILQKSERESNEMEKLERKIKISRDKHDVSSIESQLQEIQDKLKQLSK